MSPVKKTARLAGSLYLVGGIMGAWGLMVVPSQLIVRGDAAATAANLLARQSFFRLGILSTIASAVLFLFLGLVLFRLFESVHRGLATLLVILNLIMIALGFANAAGLLTALRVVDGMEYLSAFDKPQRDALTMLLLNLNYQGNIVAEVFWGFWLFPFGLLVIRSGFLPRILGGWLILGGVAYVIMSVTGVLSPEHYMMVFRFVSPLLFGEMAMMLWLLIVGARPKPQAVDTSSPVTT